MHILKRRVAKKTEGRARLKRHRKWLRQIGLARHRRRLQMHARVQGNLGLPRTREIEFGFHLPSAPSATSAGLRIRPAPGERFPWTSSMPAGADGADGIEGPRSAH